MKKFCLLVMLPGLLLSAEPEAGPHPAGWELQLRDGGGVESPFLRSREDELWLDAEGERRVPVAELLRAEFRPERE